jgi:hypothetical protein
MAMEETSSKGAPAKNADLIEDDDDWQAKQEPQLMRPWHST